MHPAASWREAWSSSGLSEPAGLLESLISRYKEPHRAYHTLRHIEECFEALAPASHLAERVAEVHLALWFHDAVYDPHAGDNERASADLARQNIKAACGGDVMSTRIETLILATRHDAPADRPDAQLIADVDLAILAAPASRFEEYQEQIRQEYSFMPEEEFQRSRTGILEDFLSRQAIYQTEWFNGRLDQAARANIASELARMPRRDGK